MCVKHCVVFRFVSADAAKEKIFQALREIATFVKGSFYTREEHKVCFTFSYRDEIEIPNVSKESYFREKKSWPRV